MILGRITMVELVPGSYVTLVTTNAAKLCHTSSPCPTKIVKNWVGPKPVLLWAEVNEWPKTSVTGDAGWIRNSID
jgi:hypothetical protein